MHIAHEVQVDIAAGINAGNRGKVGLAVYHDSQAIGVGESVDEIALGVGLVLGFARGLGRCGRRLGRRGQEARGAEAEDGGGRKNPEKAKAAAHEDQ